MGHLEKWRITSVEGASACSALVHFSPVLYAVEFPLKHFWNMSVKNAPESWDADYAAPLHNSF